ncbi:MAG: nucleotide exchange factor GrpE [Rickettsiales bacterium]|jgi:molecular chaperone GrpE|nr:nucleotide exchange factor GrpE [Rickettsiales bacterium]
MTKTTVGSNKGFNMEEKTNEAEIEKVKISDSEDPNANGADASEIESLNIRIADLNAVIADLNDKYLRLAAELENTRRRAAIDSENSMRGRAMSIAGQFLPVMDAIEAALSHAPDDEGIRAMARAMESAFAQIGIIKIESVGQQLNPQFHNAVQVVEAPLSDEPCATKPTPNAIVGELQTGYMFGDAVLRPAMVVVGK